MMDDQIIKAIKELRQRVSGVEYHTGRLPSDFKVDLEEIRKKTIVPKKPDKKHG